MEIKNMPKAIELFNDLSKAKELVEVINKLDQDNFKTGRIYIKDLNERSYQICFLDKESEISIMRTLKEALQIIKDNKIFELKKY